MRKKMKTCGRLIQIPNDIKLYISIKKKGQHRFKVQYQVFMKPNNVNKRMNLPPVTVIAKYFLHLTFIKSDSCN